MKDRVDNLSNECINLIEVEVRIKVGLGQIMHMEVVQDTTKTLEVEEGIVQIIEVIMVTIWEVIKCMGIIIIIEKVIIGIKVRIGIEIDHLKGTEEIGEIIEVWVTVGPGQVLEQVQIEIELDVSNAGNMTTLLENVQLDKWVGRQNKYNKCLIWMKIRQYYKPHWWTQMKNNWL